MLVAKIFTILILLTLFIQDQKDRQVSWLLFPALTVVMFYQKYLPFHSFVESLSEVVYPLGFLAIQMVFLTLYFSVKTKRMLLVTDRMIGWGDVLLLLCLCFYFSLYTYIIFYILSLVAVLVIWLIWKRLDQRQNAQIPFAGLQALVLCAVLLFSWFRGPDLSNDYWIFQHLA